MTNKFLKASVGDGRCEPFVNKMSFQKFTRNDIRFVLKKYKNDVGAEKYQLQRDWTIYFSKLITLK